MPRGNGLYSAPVPLWANSICVSPGSHIRQVVPATNQSGDDNVLKKRRGSSAGRQDVFHVPGGRRPQEPAAGCVHKAALLWSQKNIGGRENPLFPGNNTETVKTIKLTRALLCIMRVYY